MRVLSIRTKFENCPPAIASLAFSLESKTYISLGKEYEVYALSVFQGVVFLQIINDLDIINWLPAWLFEVRDTALPHDWIVSFFQGEPGLVLGPEFVASDEAAYTHMVELHPKSREKFWRRNKMFTRNNKQPPDK